MANIRTVTRIPPLDFTGVRLEIGETVVHVDKTNERMTRQEEWSRKIHEQNEEIIGAFGDVNNVCAEFEEGKTDIELALLETNQAIGDLNLNFAPDHGTFIRQNNYTDSPDGLALNNAELSHESISDIVDSNNGCDVTQPVEAGRHRYDSLSHGGSEPADDVAALDFISAMHGGIVNDDVRYMPGFAVAEYTMGSTGSGTNYDDCYAWCHTTKISQRSSAHGAVSFSYYFQAIDADAWLFGEAEESSKKTFVDGVKILNVGNTDGQWLKLNRGQVYHIAGCVNLANNQFIYSALARTHVRRETKFRIALPWVSSGAFQMMPHTRPARSQGTVGQPPLFARRQVEINEQLSAALDALAAGGTAGGGGGGGITQDQLDQAKQEAQDANDALKAALEIKDQMHDDDIAELESDQAAADVRYASLLASVSTDAERNALADALRLEWAQDISDAGLGGTGVETKSISITATANQSTYPLSPAAVDLKSIDVKISGAPEMTVGTDYTVTANAVTFLTPLAALIDAGDSIQITYI